MSDDTLIVPRMTTEQRVFKRVEKGLRCKRKARIRKTPSRGGWTA